MTYREICHHTKMQKGYLINAIYRVRQFIISTTCHDFLINL